MDLLEFYSLFSQIQQIPMPKAKRGIALDGEVWYLSIPNFFENRVLDWNIAGQKDKDWEPIAQWAANMRDFFLTVFNLS
ncbi:MAG: hypothetical protein HY862_19515 [Chloroflexi bacterium]|nr:hypothetical protein [Chloroflexota bacterium]